MLQEIEQALVNYRNLTARVDAMCEDIHRHYQDDIRCCSGCDTCCQHLTLLPVEAVSIMIRLAKMSECSKKARIRKAVETALPDACPLLDQGLCLMYDARPIICRTHGMPILVDSGGQPFLDHCPLNFRQTNHIDRKRVIDLEQLNRTLVVINQLFVEQVLEPGSLPERLWLSEALALELR